MAPRILAALVTVDPSAAESVWGLRATVGALPLDGVTTMLREYRVIR